MTVWTEKSKCWKKLLDSSVTHACKRFSFSTFASKWVYVNMGNFENAFVAKTTSGAFVAKVLKNKIMLPLFHASSFSMIRTRMCDTISSMAFTLFRFMFIIIMQTKRSVFLKVFEPPLFYTLCNLFSMLKIITMATSTFFVSVSRIAFSVSTVPRFNILPSSHKYRLYGEYNLSFWRGGLMNP